MQDFHVKDYFYQVWKRRKIVGLFVVSVFVFTLLFTLQQKPVYRSMAVIEIGAETPDVFFQDVVNVSPYGWWSALKYYETQYQILKSRSLMEKVAERVIDQKIVSGSREAVTSHLLNGISVGSDEKSRLAQVYFDDSSAERSARLANLISEVYIDENLSQKLQGITQAIDWLTARLGEIRKEKSRQEGELQKVKEEYRVVSVEDRQAVSKANLMALTDSLNRIRTQKIETEAQYRKLEELVTKSERTEDLLGVVSNELLRKLRQDLAGAETEKSQLAHRYGAKHPTIIRINNEIASIEGAIRQEVSDEVRRLKTRYLLAKAQEDEVSKELESQKLQALKVDEVNRKVADIEVVTNTNQQLFESIQKKLKEVDLSSLFRSNNIRIVDRALAGDKVRPKFGLNMILALIVGLLGGIMLALGIEYLDDTLKTQEDIERYLKISVLGIIPRYRVVINGSKVDRPMELAPVEDPNSTIAEFFRTLRTNVLFLATARGYKKIQVVSTGPSEGKTSTVLNLGIALAQIAQKTVIVELDLRRPRIHTKLNPRDRKGITNVLLGESQLEDVIRRSDIPNLDYVLAGSIPPNPAELLSSVALKELLDTLAQKYDRVIIDSSPIAPVTDAVIVAQHADGVMMVVRSHQSHRRAARLALDQLQGIKADVLGVVLNDVDIERSTYGNYQYYRYGYSMYGETPDDKADEPESALGPTGLA